MIESPILDTLTRQINHVPFRLPYPIPMASITPSYSLYLSTPCIPPSSQSQVLVHPQGVASALSRVLEALRKVLEESSGARDEQAFAPLPSRVAAVLQCQDAGNDVGATTLWKTLSLCIKLGLSANASLAISVGQIKALVEEAQGVHMSLRKPCLI